MTVATTKVERSRLAIRAVLAGFAPDECAQFEAEYAQALNRTGAERDLVPAEAVLDRWWELAAIRPTPCPSSSARRLREPRLATSPGCSLATSMGLGPAVAAQLRPGVAGDRASGPIMGPPSTAVAQGLIGYVVVYERQRVIILRLG